MTNSLLGSGQLSDAQTDCVAAFLDQIARPPTQQCRHVKEGQTSFRTMAEPQSVLCATCMSLASLQISGCECCGGEIADPFASLFKFDVKHVDGLVIASIGQLCELCSSLSTSAPVTVGG